MIDPEKQDQAKQLSRIERYFMLVELLFGFLYSFAWLYFGWSEYLRDALLEITSSEWLIVIGFGAVFAGIYAIISIPLIFYEGFVLPHRFGLSTQDFKSWTFDQLKGAALAILMGIVLLEVFYLLLRTAPHTWWLWVGLFLLLFNVVLAALAPILLMPIFYKFQPLGEEHEALVLKLMDLTEKAKTYVQGVYQFDMSSKTTTANAALTGIGRSRRIVLGDNLINEFSEDEIETVLAHELAHHVFKDIPIGILVQSVITLVGLYIASVVLESGVAFFGYYGIADVAAMPLLVLALGFYGLLTMPFENAYSRLRERRADRYALEMTGKGDAYASALIKLANKNLSDVDPDRWVEILFYSHPALGKRISMAEQFSEN